MHTVLMIENHTGIRHHLSNPHVPAWSGAICEHTVVVPRPLQAGGMIYHDMADPWVVHIPTGRWQSRVPILICPLRHPVDLPR